MGSSSNNEIKFNAFIILSKHYEIIFKKPARTHCNNTAGTHFDGILKTYLDFCEPLLPKDPS
jgi:hypothetical protein